MNLQFPIEDVILQFAIVVIAVIAVQIPLERSRVPGLIGLILIGMVLGPGGAGILPEEPVIELLGSVGLLFIMFLAGLEVDLDVVRHHKREAVSYGLLAFLVTAILVAALAFARGFGWSGVLLLAAAVSSHTLLSYPLIERLGLAGRRPLVTAVGGTLLTDTLALVLLVVVTRGAGTEGDNSGGGWYWPLLLLAGLVVLSLILVPRLARVVLYKTEARQEERALALLGILLLLSVAADAIGTEDILGAFLAGICLNRLIQGREDLRDHFEFAGRMLFMPFFFVETGMWLDLDVLFGNATIWVSALALVAAIVAGKAAAAWIAGMMYGYGMLDRITMAGLTLPQAAATLAVVVTGREAGIFDEAVVDTIIIVIFVTCLVGPIVTRMAGHRLVERQQDAGPKQAVEGAQRRPSLTRAD